MAEFSEAFNEIKSFRVPGKLLEFSEAFNTIKSFRHAWKLVEALVSSLVSDKYLLNNSSPHDACLESLSRVIKLINVVKLNSPAQHRGTRLELMFLNEAE